MTAVPVGDVALLIASVAALWFGARWLVDAASTLARRAGVSALVVGLTVVAFGTSAPEITVSVGAALEGRGDVAVGNAVGSNVFNLGVVLGLVAAFVPFRVTETLVRRDALAMAVATGLGTLVLVDLAVSRLEGGVLLGTLFVYLGWLVAATRRSNAVESEATANADDPRGSEPGWARGGSGVGRQIVRLLVGLALVVAGGRLLVDAATRIAVSAGVSEWVIGVTIVAAGTSLPELVTSVVAARRGEVAIAAGNVVGSNVFNLLGVLGLAALVRPLAIAPAALEGLAWLVGLTAVATVLLATGRRLTRLEGIALVAIVAVYWITSVL
ncbi:calcium/sodium antiporter [Natrialbaceae archaeon GCM10025810]|uniref:calcium/sodium antiporter n=1 Tax=Halovalidus salilacus TaxID=3075124 RepID=UPI00361F56A1